MRVTVDYDLCDSTGVCNSFAPEVFELDDEDLLHVRVPEPGAELWPAVEEAARACPKLAILLPGDRP
ncbi:ferredoxin [Actinoplanes sp. NPDC051861]|uniref:ferredoxin n=1 Tax=Actinoplanes sp. NPDC051861 TaxID=3155170 RepID=UPI003436FFAE